MDVNKIKITPIVNSQEIVIPLDMRWDLLNREDTLINEENSIIKEVIGTPTNYELVRFSRRPFDLSVNSNFFGGQTEVRHVFKFYSGATDTWETTYLTRFNDNDIRFSSNSYKKSFFKFDFYDTTSPQTQKIYLSLILQTSQSAPFLNNCGVYRLGSLLNNTYTVTFNYTDCCGVEQTFIVPDGLPPGSPQSGLQFCGLKNSVVTVNATDGVNNLSYTYTLIDALQYQFGEPIVVFHAGDGLGGYLSCNCTDTNFPIIYIPDFVLDHYGDQEGYFIYWYEDESLLNLSELYMKVKFFDGGTGQYTTFTVNPQSSYVNKYTIPNDDFYVRVQFFYNQKWYDFFDILTGNVINVCNWYEYTNPPIV